MGPSIRIEPAVIEDAAQIAHVLRQSICEALPFLPKLHTPDEDFEFVRERLIPSNQVYVARMSDGTIVGYIAFDDNWINHLYLLMRCTRAGIGTQLLNIAKSQRSHLKLWCFQKNESARRFYEKHGFIISKETDGSGNEEKEPDVLYEWTTADL